MRRLSALAGAIALVAGACGASSSSPSMATPPPAATERPAASTAESPSPSVATTIVHVTFDGQSCTYVGPTSIPAGTRLVFVFENTPAAVAGSTKKGVASIGSDLFVTAISRGAGLPTPAATKGTWNDPMWALDGVAAYGFGPKANATTIATGGAYYVGCHQYWGQLGGRTFAFYPATVIQVE